jgi:hypothetical protein
VLTDQIVSPRSAPTSGPVSPRTPVPSSRLFLTISRDRTCMVDTRLIANGCKVLGQHVERAESSAALDLHHLPFRDGLKLH